jgi:hypothetical protein
MKTAVCKLKSVSPYSQSKVITDERKNKELHKDFEERTWRNRLHRMPDGSVFIPPMSLSNCIKEAAKYMSIQVPGKAKQTYTKNFEAGVLVSDPIVLPNHADDVEGEWQFVPSDGKRGGGKRVWKCFPLIPEWEGTATYYILDDIITQDVFDQVLRGAGQFIGIGRFRPRNCGFYGRYKVEEVQWTEM